MKNYCSAQILASPDELLLPSEDNESLLKLLLMNSNVFVLFKGSRIGVFMKSDTQFEAKYCVERTSLLASR